MSPRVPHRLVQEYGEVLQQVDRVPRTTDEIYRRWVKIERGQSLSRRRTNERRWLGKTLEHMARRGDVRRGIFHVTPNFTTYAFWRD